MSDVVMTTTTTTMNSTTRHNHNNTNNNPLEMIYSFHDRALHYHSQHDFMTSYRALIPIIAELRHLYEQQQCSIRNSATNTTCCDHEHHDTSNGSSNRNNDAVVSTNATTTETIQNANVNPNNNTEQSLYNASSYVRPKQCYHTGIFTGLFNVRKLGTTLVSRRHDSDDHDHHHNHPSDDDIVDMIHLITAMILYNIGVTIHLMTMEDKGHPPIQIRKNLPAKTDALVYYERSHQILVQLLHQEQSPQSQSYMEIGSFVQMALCLNISELRYHGDDALLLVVPTLSAPVQHGNKDVTIPRTTTTVSNDRSDENQLFVTIKHMVDTCLAYKTRSGRWYIMTMDDICFFFHHWLTSSLQNPYGMAPAA
jgi:hypothetical protein